MLGVTPERPITLAPPSSVRDARLRGCWTVNVPAPRTSDWPLTAEVRFCVPVRTDPAGTDRVSVAEPTFPE